MFSKAINYSFRVWVTSVLVSPIIYLPVSFYRQSEPLKLVDAIEGAIPIYMLFVVLETALSSVTYLVFAAMVWLAVATIRHDLWLKSVTFSIGVMLSIGNYVLICRSELADSDYMFFTMMLCNTATIGWACWFYDLKPKEKQLNTNYNNNSSKMNKKTLLLMLLIAILICCININNINATTNSNRASAHVAGPYCDIRSI